MISKPNDFHNTDKIVMWGCLAITFLISSVHPNKYNMPSVLNYLQKDNQVFFFLEKVKKIYFPLVIFWILLWYCCEYHKQKMTFFWKPRMLFKTVIMFNSQRMLCYLKKRHTFAKEPSFVPEERFLFIFLVSPSLWRKKWERHFLY